MYDRMPPKLGPSDTARLPIDPSAVGLDSRIRLVTRHAARLAIEGQVACLYYCTTNSRVYHGDPEPPHIDFDLECGPALEKVRSPHRLNASSSPSDLLTSDSTRLDSTRPLLSSASSPPPPDPPADHSLSQVRELTYLRAYLQVITAYPKYVSLRTYLLTYR